MQKLSNWKHSLKIKGEGLLSLALNLALNKTAIKENKDPNTGKREKKLTLSHVESLGIGTSSLVTTNTNGTAFRIENGAKVVEEYVHFLNKLSDSPSHLTVTSPFALRFAKQNWGSISCCGEFDVAWIE